MSNINQLVLTHGTSDLQIILTDDAGSCMRGTPDKKYVRKFHDWLLQQKDQVVVLDLPPELQERNTEVIIDTLPEGDTFSLLGEDKPVAVQVKRDEQGRLQVVLPKISPPLCQWFEKNNPAQPQHEATKSTFAAAFLKAGIKPPPLQRVLVLSTDRGSEAQEPIATFFFLKQWLTQKGVPEEQISEVIYLKGKERLESNQHSIAPLIAQRLEQALRTFYTQTEGGKSTLLLACNGGLPAVKPLLQEIALLLANHQGGVQVLFKTEFDLCGDAPTSIEELRIRRQCAEQIRRGALLDAWIIASPLRRQGEQTPSWLVGLNGAAQLLNGNPVSATMPVPALQAIVKQAEVASCLLVAIRVETALLNERWLEAINGTLTFLDAAFHNAINNWATTHLEDYEPRRRKMQFKEPPAPALLRDALEVWKEHEKIVPLTYRANVVGEKALAAWGVELNKPAINTLREAIHKKPNRLADYRNYNTHGVMTQSEIDTAIKRFMGANLWSQGVNNPQARPKPGKCFLARPVVMETIQCLLEPSINAEGLYQTLLQDLEKAVVHPES